LEIPTIIAEIVKISVKPTNTRIQVSGAERDEKMNISFTMKKSEDDEAWRKCEPTSAVAVNTETTEPNDIAIPAFNFPLLHLRAQREDLLASLLQRSGQTGKEVYIHMLRRIHI
jgi:hypothetical protein